MAAPHNKYMFSVTQKTCAWFKRLVLFTERHPSNANCLAL